jgi:hypothetical protein
MKFRILVMVAAGLILFSARSASATLFQTTSTLSGANDVPPVVTPGTGTVEADYDSVAQTLHLHVIFSGLLSGTTAAHIHAPAGPGSNAGVATTVPRFVGFPVGVTSGDYETVLDLTLASSYNPAYVTANGNTVPGAEAALAAALLNGQAYLNIHTTQNPGGEVRAFLQLTPVVPEPATAGLAALGLGGLGLVLARRRAR